MGVDMDLEFEKYCKVDQSPTTVLPSLWYAKHESRSRKGKPGSRNDRASLEAGFREIKFRNYHRSISCKSLATRNNELSVDGKVLKRGSVYQSSKERNSFQRSESVGGRKKIEVSLSGDSPFSFSLLDSICGSDKEEEPSEVSRSPDTSLTTNTVCSVESSRESKYVKLDARESISSRPAERDLMENPKFKSYAVVGPSSSANILKEDNQAFQKSLAAKLAFPHSPAHSADSYGSKGSPKSRFSPIRKIFDPLSMTKPHRSPMSPKLESGEISSSDPMITGKNKRLQKTLLHDTFSGMPNMDVQYVKDVKHIVLPCLPAHLHGDLKLEQKQGVPYFELSLSHSEDVLVAKTWKAEDTFNWVYTFHSVQGRKRSDASARGMNYSDKDSPIVGQMQVSCHLLSELKDGGAFSDSMVTEFVLYDIMHARKSLATEESVPAPDVVEVVNASNEDLTPRAFETSSLDFSNPYPWAPADLHPSLEIAAVVIQVPFEKRESLKYRSGDTFSHQVHPDLLDLSLVEQTPKRIADRRSKTVNVVTPMGNHSLPTSESRGPLPLLDKWRLGGGCDCGGWDMACPIVVFANPGTNFKEDNSFLQNDQPFELYVQGAKEKTPALTIKLNRTGHYAVDFHAQLSTLQAFSICVAMLHTTEASTIVDQEKHKQLVQCSFPKALVDDEVKILIETVTEEKDKGTEKVRKTAEDHSSSFMLNPPFSPIARV